MVAAPNGGKVVNLTVRQAMARYVDYKRLQGQPVNDLPRRSNAHILPALGDLVVAELTLMALLTHAAQQNELLPIKRRRRTTREPWPRPTWTWPGVPTLNVHMGG